MDRSTRALPRRSDRAGRTLLATLIITATMTGSFVALPGGVASADPLVTGTDGDEMEFTFVADAADDRAVVLLGTDGTDTVDADVETVRVRIEWGDGTSTDRTEVGFVSHTYAAPGTYTVKIWPLYADAGGSDAGPWLTLYGANRDGGSFYWAPLGAGPGEEADDIARMTAVGSFGDLGITSLSNAFNRHRYLTDVPTTLPSNVSDLGYTFRYAATFNDAHVGSWDVSEVKRMEGTFSNAAAFNQPLDSWDVGSATTMVGMFQDAVAFNQPLGSWDVSDVTTMERMFEDAVAFNQDLTNWSVNNVTTMLDMFLDATAFDGDISTWKDRVGNVQDFSNFLMNATSFDQDLPDWNVSGANDLDSFFEGATSFNGSLTGWTFSSDVDVDIDVSNMFQDASAFNQDLSSWNTSRFSDTNDMFYGAEKFNGDVTSWDVSNVTDMTQMFEDALAFNQDLTDWDVSSVTTMNNMFEGATSFNGEISTWKDRVGNVQDFSDFLKDATSFNQDLPGWDVSGSDDLDSFFEGATSFNGALTGWTFSSTVGIDASNMFEDASAFNQDLSSWTTTSFDDTNDMFYGASAFNQDVSSWDVSNVTDMTNMFRDAEDFDQDLGDWTLNPSVNLAEMLNDSGMSVNCYDATLIGWAALAPAVTGRSLGAVSLLRTDRSAAAYARLDGARGWTITDGGDGGVPAGPCSVPEVTSAAAPAPSGPRVTVVTPPTAEGDPVVGQVSGGDAGIDILWRLVGPDGATLVEGPVTLDDSGAGTITTTLPSAATGGYRLVLVDWGAEDSFTLGPSDGPVPTGVPAGEGPGDDRAVRLVIPVLLASAVLLRRRAWTV